MSDFKNHGDKPIEFCGDQEGWIAVGSLTDDSPNSPCYPRVVLLGVGLGPSGKMHPSNIAAMLTIAQATDLRARLTEAMAVDRPAPTPTPAPGLDLDAVADTMRGLDNIFAQAMSSRDAEIARLTAELAAARAVPADVEAAIEELRRAEEVDARAMTGQSLAARVLAEATLRTAIARAISDATAARGTVGGLLAAGEERESRAWSEKGKAPPGSCPFCASRISMVQRDGYFIARCSHRGCGAVGPRMRSVSRAADLFCQPPRREAQGMSCGPIVASPPRPRCSCTHEAGDSRCNVHPTCSECGASTTRPVDGCEACRGPLPKGG